MNITTKFSDWESNNSSILWWVEKIIVSLLYITLIHYMNERGRKLVSKLEILLIWALDLLGQSLFTSLCVKLILSFIYNLQVTNPIKYYLYNGGLHSEVRMIDWVFHYVNVSYAERRIKELKNEKNYIIMRDEFKAVSYQNKDNCFNLVPFAEIHKDKASRGYVVGYPHNDSIFMSLKGLELSGRCHDWAINFAKLQSKNGFSTYSSVLLFRWVYWPIFLLGIIDSFRGERDLIVKVLFLIILIWDNFNTNEVEIRWMNKNKIKARGSLFDWVAMGSLIIPKIFGIGFWFLNYVTFQLIILLLYQLRTPIPRLIITLIAIVLVYYISDYMIFILILNIILYTSILTIMFLYL